MVQKKRSPQGQTRRSAPAKGGRGRGGEQRRKKMLAAVHIAKGQLGLDEQAYRDALESIVGKRSAGDCSLPELGKVLDAFRRAGAVSSERSPQPPLSKGGNGSKAAPRYREGQLGKLVVLWRELHEAGKVEQFTEVALCGWCFKRFGVERPEWLDGKQRGKAIEMLKQWLAR